MTIIIGIIVAIIIFSIIILVHEYGHFKSARFFGVRVEEFGLGIPPRAKKLWKDKHGTLFSLNWLPLGGFVKLTGENINTFYVFKEDGELYNNDNLEKDLKSNKNIFDKNKNKLTDIEKEKILEKLLENTAEYSLQNKSSRKQAIIILAGVFMNFLLAIFVFSILFFIGVKPIGINDKIEVNSEIKLIPTYEQAIESGLLIKNHGVILYPVEGSIAEKAGIEKGDVLSEIIIPHPNPLLKGEGEVRKITTANELVNIVKNNSGNKLVFKIQRKGLIKDIPIIPSSLRRELGGGQEGKIGAYIGENIKINKDFEYRYGLLESVKYGTLETYNQIMLTFKALGILSKKIFNPETPEERQEAVKQVSGPIGMVDFISKSVTGGIIFLLIIGAIISINLGVFNLLPIPALDGGRFLFITVNGVIKKIFGKKVINENLEAIIHFMFFVLLIVLSIIIAYNDINKIINN